MFIRSVLKVDTFVRLLLMGDMAEYAEELSKLGAECMVVNDPLIADRALKHMHLWRRHSRKFPKYY